jgi:dTDP-4-amino-4,6-dideoxygalactose transaminase
VPPECRTNYHLLYLLLPTGAERDRLLEQLHARGIHAVFHYVPLHTSPMGRKLGGREGDLPVTEDVARRLVRLPMFYGITDNEQRAVVDAVFDSLGPDLADRRAGDEPRNLLTAAWEGAPA